MRRLMIVPVVAALVMVGIVAFIGYGSTAVEPSGRLGVFPNNFGGWALVAVIAAVVVGFGLTTVVREHPRFRRPARIAHEPMENRRTRRAA
jgi:uncharacterized membrane protein